MVNINKNEYYGILIIHEEKLKYISIFMIHYQISITFIKRSADLILNFLFIFYFIKTLKSFFIF